MITHVKRDECELLHISHLFYYVSAWENTEEMMEQFMQDVNGAVRQARETGKTQVVNLDGEFDLHVTAAGWVILMLPWKRYRVANMENELFVKRGKSNHKND